MHGSMSQVSMKRGKERKEECFEQNVQEGAQKCSVLRVRVSEEKSQAGEHV